MHAFFSPPESITQTSCRSLQPFLHSSQHSVFEHARVWLSPKSYQAAWGDLVLHLIHGFLDQPESKSQTASRSVQPFLRSSRQSVAILYKGSSLFPLKLHYSTGDLNRHLIYGSLRPSESSTQTVSRSVQPFLQGSLLWQTYRPTDRPTDHAPRSVTTGLMCIRSTAMRPNNNYYY